MAKRSNRRRSSRSNPVARFALVALLAIAGAAVCAVIGAMFGLIGLQAADVSLVGHVAMVYVGGAAVVCALPGLLIGAGLGLSIRQ